MISLSNKDNFQTFRMMEFSDCLINCGVYALECGYLMLQAEVPWQADVHQENHSECINWASHQKCSFQSFCGAKLWMGKIQKNRNHLRLYAICHHVYKMQIPLLGLSPMGTRDEWNRTFALKFTRVEEGSKPRNVSHLATFPRRDWCVLAIFLLPKIHLSNPGEGAYPHTRPAL